MSIETRALTIQTAENETAKGQRSENMELTSRVETNLIATPQWTFSQLVGKKRLVTSVTLDTTAVRNDLLYTYNNSVTNFMQLFNNIPMSRYFRFVRYNLVFELEIQSHFQQQGALIVNTLPSPIGTNSYWYIGLPNQPLAGGLYDKVLYPHDFISLGHSGNYKIILPWIANRSFLAFYTESGATGVPLADMVMNSLHLAVFDPLRVVASAVNSVTIRIWAHAEDVQFSGYLASF